MQGFYEKQSIIVVAKDEKYLNLLRKLVETNDDKEDGTIVGIEDGLFDIVTWDEKTWLSQKKMGQITSKILLIGNIKDTDKLLPLINIKFQKYGVTYGWSGRQTLIHIDTKELEDEETFSKFKEEYNALDIPEQFKIKDKSTEVVDNSKQLKWFEKIGKKLKSEGNKLKDAITFKVDTTDKLTIYGIVTFYLNHIDEFIKL